MPKAGEESDVLGKPKQALKTHFEKVPRFVRRVVGGLLLLISLRGFVDDLVGVADWSGAVWSYTSSIPAAALIGLVGLLLLTIDLWWPAIWRPARQEEAAPDSSPPTPSIEPAEPEGDGSKSSHPERVEASEETEPSEDDASSLEDRLIVERQHGQMILNAIRTPGFQTLWQYDSPPMPSDVEPWKVNIDHLLRNREDLLNLFHYAPPRLRSQTLSESFLDVLRGGSEVRRLEQLLQQLDRVIERL